MSSESPAGARRRYPLHLHLSALFSALVLATGVAIAWLGYGQARDITLKATDDVFRHVGAETRSALAGALQPVGSFADLLALQPLARARTLERRLEALPFMRRAFAGHAPIAAAYAGYDDGGFFLVRPLRSDAERAFFEAPAGTALYAQNIDVGPSGTRTVTHLFFDAALRELARRTADVYDFDPRTRLWYRLAERPGERVLTEPYVFFSTQAPGMTVAVRAGTESVVGVDVALHQVSELLATLRTLPDMKIVLFGADRRVIARADLDRTMVRRDGDRVALATLDEFGEMSLAARMMAIADIFEALTAADRPYKKGKTLSEALKIMSFMRRDRHVDPDLFDLFLNSGVYRSYAERFLRPEQIDAVDVAQYVGRPQAA